jgi:outer membrane receptor protein involved in Fe transport
MMKTLLLKLFSCLALVVTTASTFAQADTSGLNSLSLQDLLNVKITTASRTTQSSELASAVVTVVTKDQIRSRGYQSLLDLIYDLPDVKVDDKIYSGIRNSVTIRGTQGTEKFVILLDGVSISTPSGEAMPIMQNYPVHLAEQVEILYGPASALYGANAMSGVINIITKKSRKPGTLELTITNGDYGYTNSTLFATKKLGENMNLVVSGQYFYDRGPDYSKLYNNDPQLSLESHKTGTFNTIYGPHTPVKPVRAVYEAPMTAYNIYVGLYSDHFSFNFFRNYFKIPNSWENNTSNAIYNKEVFMAQSITMAIAAYKRTFNRTTSTTSLMASKYELDPNSNYRNLYSAMESAYKFSTNTTVKAEQQMDYKLSKNTNVTAGISYEHVDAIPQSADLDAPVNTHDYVSGVYLGTRAFYRPEGLPAQFFFTHFDNLGAYAQAQLDGKKISLTLGARYDHNSRYGSTFNPRLGIVYQPSKYTTIKLLYGSAYRAPSASDAYIQYGAFETADSGRTYHSHFLHLPNPDLGPIRSYNAELNIQQRLSDNVVLILDGYHTFIKGVYGFSDDSETTKRYNNMFNGIPVDYVEVFTNSNRQKTFGASIQLKCKQSYKNISFNSYVALSYVDGVKEKGLVEDDETEKDQQLDFIAPWMLRIGSDIKSGKFTCSPRLLLMGRQRISGISDTTGYINRQTIPGYALLNISIRYNISKQASVFVNVCNALNQRYRAVGFNMDLKRDETELYHGQPQDPVRVMAGFNFSF